MERLEESDPEADYSGCVQCTRRVALAERTDCTVMVIRRKITWYR